MCVHGAASLRTIFLLFFFDQSTTRNTRDGRSSTNQQSTADCDITGTSATRDTRSKLVRKVLHLPISATTVSPVITSNQPAFLTPSPNELDLRARLTGSSLTFYPKSRGKPTSWRFRHWQGNFAPTRAQRLERSGRKCERVVSHEVDFTGQRWQGLRQIIQA